MHWNCSRLSVTVRNTGLALGLVALSCASARAQEARTALVNISLERQAGLGPGSSYRVEIDDGGLVRFTGLGGLLHGWTDSMRVSPDTVRALAAEFERAGFFDLDTAYVRGTAGCGRSVFDASTATLAVTWHGRTKRVVHYRGCLGPDSGPSSDSRRERLTHPPGVLGRLAALASRVDAVAPVNTHWVKD